MRFWRSLTVFHLESLTGFMVSHRSLGLCGPWASDRNWVHPLGIVFHRPLPLIHGQWHGQPPGSEFTQLARQPSKWVDQAINLSYSGGTLPHSNCIYLLHLLPMATDFILRHPVIRTAWWPISELIAPWSYSLLRHSKSVVEGAAGQAMAKVETSPAMQPDTHLWVRERGSSARAQKCAPTTEVCMLSPKPAY